MSLVERLHGRVLPTETVPLPANPDEYARLDRDLAAATWALEQARDRGSADVAALRAAVDAAQAALHAQPVVEVTVRALPPAVWEALVDECPPTEDERGRNLEWNVATFRPALLSASVVLADGEEPPDWELLAKEGQLTVGELNSLFTVAINLNYRGPARAVGKGS